MKIANKKYDFSYKKKIDTLKIEKPILALVKKVNSFDWCMTLQSCGGHTHAKVVFNPWIEFIIKDEKFFKYILQKCMGYNEPFLYFTVKIEFNDARTNLNLQSWFKVAKIVPSILIQFNLDVAKRGGKEAPTFLQMQKTFINWFKIFGGLE